MQLWSRGKRLFSTQLMKKKKVKARMLAKKAPGFEHLHFDRLVHPETGANIHLVGIRSASPNDVPIFHLQHTLKFRSASQGSVALAAGRLLRMIPYLGFEKKTLGCQ